MCRARSLTGCRALHLARKTVPTNSAETRRCLVLMCASPSARRRPARSLHLFGLLWTEPTAVEVSSALSAEEFAPWVDHDKHRDKPRRSRPIPRNSKHLDATTVRLATRTCRRRRAARTHRPAPVYAGHARRRAPQHPVDTRAAIAAMDDRPLRSTRGSQRFPYRSSSDSSAATPTPREAGTTHTDRNTSTTRAPHARRSLRLHPAAPFQPTHQTPASLAHEVSASVWPGSRDRITKPD